jgi:hypothetical protein
MHKLRRGASAAPDLEDVSDCSKKTILMMNHNYGV